jgi:hypothetical protein
MTAGSAQAQPDPVTDLRWTKPKLEVGVKAKKSTLKMTLSGNRGICGASVDLSSSRGGSLSMWLSRVAGSKARGTYSTDPTSWSMDERGTWRVTAIYVQDCDGVHFVRKQASGIGGTLKVFTKRKITKLALTSVPRSLLRDSRDVATVKVTAGGKKVNKAPVRLLACATLGQTGCKRIGSGRTGANGVAKISYTMPRKQVYIVASYAGSKKNTLARSSVRTVYPTWTFSPVGVAVEVSPEVTATYAGHGPVTARFSRPLCDVRMTVVTDTYTRDYSQYGCVSEYTFRVAFDNRASTSVTHTLAVSVKAGGGVADGYAGTSAPVTFVVPAYPY